MLLGQSCVSPIFWKRKRHEKYGAPSVAKSLFDDIKRNVTKFIKCNEIQRNEIQMPWNKIPIPWNPIIEICPLPWLYKVRWSFRNAFVWFSFLPYPTRCGSWWVIVVPRSLKSGDFYWDYCVLPLSLRCFFIVRFHFNLYCSLVNRFWYFSL